MLILSSLVSVLAPKFEQKTTTDNSINLLKYPSFHQPHNEFNIIQIIIQN